MVDVAATMGTAVITVNNVWFLISRLLLLFNRFAHSAEPTYWVVGGWVVLSLFFVFIGWVGLLVFFVFMLFQFGSSGHPPIQPKEQLFNQPSEATQQNRTNQLISLLGCRIVGLLGHWVVWLKGCGVVGSLGHPPIQSKNNFSTNPDKQHNRTKPSNQPINQSTQSVVPARKLKQPTWPNSQEPQPTNQNYRPTKTKKTN